LHLRKWHQESNYAWLEGGIQNGKKFRIVSPWSGRREDLADKSIFTMEIEYLWDKGYRPVTTDGVMYMVPMAK
jgi:hypothetical protein